MLQRNAQEALPNKQVCRLATLLRRDGLTLAAIAAELNAHGYRTRQGKAFHKTSVLRLLPLPTPPGSQPVTVAAAEEDVSPMEEYASATPL